MLTSVNESISKGYLADEARKPPLLQRKRRLYDTHPEAGLKESCLPNCSSLPFPPSPLYFPFMFVFFIVVDIAELSQGQYFAISL